MMSLTILREQENQARPWGVRQVDAVELSIETDVLWERVVHLALT